MDVKVDITDRVLRPPSEVYQAIIDPAKLSQYFTSEANVPLSPQAHVRWHFADVGVELEPDIKVVEPDRLIVFDWTASGQKARVEIELERYDERSTKIHIVESSFPMTPEGVKCALGQTRGWTDFIDCMRAYLEFGVRLRQGRLKDLH